MKNILVISWLDEMKDYDKNNLDFSNKRAIQISFNNKSIYINK